MKRLSAAEIEELVGLLKRAVSLDQLETYVFLGTGDRLFVEYVGAGLPLTQTIRKLIEATELGPVTDRFLRVAYREKEYQTELRACIARLYPAIPATSGRVPALCTFQVGGTPAGAASEGPGLERNVRPYLPSPDTDVWLDRFAAVKRMVCRVEVNGQGIGTGFLVGPEAVLTNWHVAKAARDAGMANSLACRFDYRRLTGGGVDPGTLVPVAAVAAERPCSAGEMAGDPDTVPPDANDLDYALLRLGTAQPDRGTLRLADPPPVAPDAPLVIVQHPNGEPLRFALDTQAVIGPVHGGLRLRYRTNTEPGSSGSPCFGMEWDLVALHHLGDPALGTPSFNQGVPVGLIRASIVDAGAGALLAA